MSRKLRIEHPGEVVGMQKAVHPPQYCYGGREGRMQSGPGGRRKDIMRLKWVAQRLHMGSWTCASNLPNEQPQTHPQAQEELRLCQ